MSGFDSNSVRKALQGAESAGDHPDADLLTAFSEGTLLPRERESVLAHAGECMECRQVLNLTANVALASSPIEARPAASPKWNLRRVWIPSFAAAAAVVLVAIAMVRNAPDKQGTPLSVAENTPATISPAPPSVSTNVQAEATPAKNTTVLPAKKQVSSPQTQAAPALANEAAENNLVTAEIAPTEASRVQSPAAVSAFSNTVTSKALANASVSIARPHWRINELGQPERAFGNGPWEQVLPNKSQKMRVLSIFAGEVWVGGEKSTVMHSFDNGTTWRVVQLPEKNGEDHVIAHIRMENAETITVEAADGTSWSSVDGGKTWR